MPEKLDRCVKKLMAKGKSKERAYAICTASLKKSENMESLCEIVQSANLSVDRQAGVIRGVRILGPVSQNGRRYTLEAVAKGRELYEGRPVNLNHPKRSEPNPERSVQDRIGWLEGVAVVDGGLTGDFNVINAHSFAPSLLETAERYPRLFGLSHNVDARTRRENGTTMVEEIVNVRSVDLVSDPATTKSLFEQAGGMVDEVPIDAAGGVGAIPGGVDDTVRMAFRTAMMAVLDNPAFDMATILGKIEELLKSRDIATEQPEGGSDNTIPSKNKETDNMTDEEKKTAAAKEEEEKKRKKALESLTPEALREEVLAMKGEIAEIKELKGQIAALKTAGETAGESEEVKKLREEIDRLKPTAEKIEEIKKLHEKLEGMKTLIEESPKSGKAEGNGKKADGKPAENAEQFCEAVTGRKPKKQE